MLAPQMQTPRTNGASAETKATSRHFTSCPATTEAQMNLLLDLIRHAPRDTYDLRRNGISHPAGRVQDLLKRGYVISTDRISTIDGDGFAHSGVALYSLITEPSTALVSKAVEPGYAVHAGLQKRLEGMS